MSTIQFIDEERRDLLHDLGEIARGCESLKADSPQAYRREAIRRMRRYLQTVSEHPTFTQFCQKTCLNRDEFIADVLRQAVDAL
jgi:hypothetical protein